MRCATSLPFDVRQMALDELRVLAEAQKQSYLRGDATDDAAGLELFRRAISECDEAARKVVVEVYRSLLMTQVRLPVARSLLVEADELSVDQAFQRFWAQTWARRILEFDDFAGILST